MGVKFPCGDCADLWGDGFKMCVKNPPTGIRSLLAAISTFEVSGHACSSEAALLAKQIRSIHEIEFFLYTHVRTDVKLHWLASDILV